MNAGIKKTLKIVFAGLAGVLVLVSGLVAYVLLVLDPNDYKSELAAVAQQETGVELTLGGDLSWRFYPSLGLSLGEASLKDPDFEQPLATIGQASVSVPLMPLLKGQVAIEEVLLSRVALTHHVRADGRSNWDTLLARLSQKPPTEDTGPVTLAIEQFSLTEGALTLSDARTGLRQEVTALEASAEQIDLAGTFPVRLAGQFEQTLGTEKTTAQWEVSSQVSPRLETQQPVLDNVTLVLGVTGAGLPGPLTLNAKAQQIAAAVTAQTVHVKGFEAQATVTDPARAQPLTANLTGDIQVDATQGWVKIPNLALQAVLSDPALAQALPVTLSTALEARWLEGAVSLNTLTVKAADVVVSGALSAALPALATGGADPLAGFKLSGQLQTQPFNPRAVLQTLGITPPKTRRADVLRQARLSTTLSGDQQQVVARDLRLTLDRSVLTGEVGVRELPKARLFARLNLDALNVDDYLPPEASGAAATSAPAATTAQAQAEALLPVALLREQNMDVVFKAGLLTLAKTPIRDLSVDASARDGLVTVRTLSGRAQDGTFSVPLTIDVRGAQPRIALKPVLRNVDLGPIALQALKRDIFAGRLNFNGDVSVTGNTVDAWLASAQGENRLNLDQGVLKGVNVLDGVLAALGQNAALLQMLAPREMNSARRRAQNTDISKALGVVQLQQGVVNNTDMQVVMPGIQVTGSGQYALATDDVDYRFQLKLDRSIWGERHARMADYPIPVRCRGNLAGNLATLCRLDPQGLQALVAQAAQARLGEEVERGKADLQRRLEERLPPAQQEAVRQILDVFKR